MIDIVSKELVIPDNPFDARDEWATIEEAQRDVAAALDFRRLLKDIDSRLDLIWVKEGTRAFPKGERWYIRRHNDYGMDNYWLVEDEHEDFCVPDIRHLRRLQEYDTAAHPDVWQKFVKRRLDKQLRAEKAMEEKSLEFRTKLGERLAHEFDAQIAVTSGMKAAIEGKAVKAPPLPPAKQKRRKHKNR